jgi:predicted transcriptional regulator
MAEQDQISFTIRIDKPLRDAFVETCKAQDRTASQLIRDFMREYIKRNSQRDIFSK